MTAIVAVILAVYVLTGAVAAEAVARRKGRAGAGFAIGLLLGWAGVAVVAFVPPTREMQVRRERERQQIQREAADILKEKP